MSKFNSEEMANAVSQHKNVNITKSFFGLVETAIYIPTNSKIGTFRRYYAKEVGECFYKLNGLSEERLDEYVNKMGKLPTNDNGNMKVEFCLSQDNNFLVMQIFQYLDLNYHPISAVIVYEGKIAKIIAKLF